MKIHDSINIVMLTDTQFIKKEEEKNQTLMIKWM